MRLAIIYIFLIVSFGLNAQVLTDFNATATVFFVRGTAPDYSIQALINNTTGQYSASDVQVGDVLYMSEASSCVRFQVLTVTVVGSSIAATVRDIDGITSAFPMGIGMICRETANFAFPLHVDGISDDLLSCVRTHFTELVDLITVTGVPGADTDSIYFDSAGVVSLATRGDTVILPIGGGVGIDTDEQNLSRSGDSILIERGTGVDLADLRDNTDTSGYNLDFRVSNDTIFVRDGSGELFAVLPSGVVDIDTDSIFVDSAGVKTYLVQRGGTIYVSGDEVNDADADATNEIQTLTKSNDTIYLSDGGFVIDTDTDTNTDTDTLYFQFGSTIIRKVRNDTVNIPVAIDTTFASNDTIFFVSNGDTSIVILDVPGDNWGNQVVVSDATLSGNGTVSSPLSVVFPIDQVDDADADPTNEIQLLSKSNDTIYLSNGGGFVIDTDTDTNTDEQNLSLVSDSLKIERGSGVDLSKYLDNTDTSGYNAILTIANDSVYITDGNGTLKAALPQDLVFDGDSSVTNEIQDITSLATTGGLPDDPVTYDLSLTNSDVTVSITDRVADSDSDPANEIQDLSIVTDSLLITNGAGVSLLPYKDNTDTSGYNLSLVIQNDSVIITDGAGTLKAALPPAVVNTDDQLLSIDSTGRIFTIALEDGGQVTFEDQVGGFPLPTDSITFNNNETGPDEGELNWDQTIGFPVFGGVGGISIKLGQDALWLCENQTGSPITKGTVVGVVGALGNSGKFLIAPFRADGNTDNDYLLGIAAEDIPSGSDGYVTHQGKIRQIDLTAYPQGAILYASPTVAGELTTIEPANGFQKFPIAFVVDSSANGTLGVRVKTGEALRDLHDVDVSTAADGDLIYYDATAGYWKTKQDSVIDDDADPSNEIQTLSWDAGANGQDEISLNNGGGTITITDDWGNQVIYTDEDVDGIGTLTGDGTSLSPLKIAQQGATSGEVLKWSNTGQTWLPALDQINDADAVPTNELQDLQLTANILSLTLSSPTVDLSVYLDNTDSQQLSWSEATRTLSLDNSASVVIADNINDADSDPSNEIQNLTWNQSTGTLALSNSSPASIEIGQYSGAERGLVPDVYSVGGSTRFLRSDGTWQIPLDNQNLSLANVSAGVYKIDIEDGNDVTIDSDNGITLTSPLSNELKISGPGQGNGIGLEVNDLFVDSENLTEAGILAEGDFFVIDDANVGGASLSTRKISPANLRLSLMNNDAGFITTQTDDQQISEFAIVSNNLNLTLEGDATGQKTVDLSPYLDNTDSQGFTGSDNGTTFTFDLSGTTNDISLTEGSNVTMTRVGTNVTINATGDGNGVYDGSGTIPTGTISTINGNNYDYRAATGITETKVRLLAPTTGSTDGSAFELHKDDAGSASINFINGALNTGVLYLNDSEDFGMNAVFGDLKFLNGGNLHLGVNQDGTIDLPDYGSGTITGTPSYYLAVDAAGNVIEATPATGTDDQNLITPTLSGTTLTLNIENGNSASIDLAALQDGNGIYDTNNEGSAAAVQNIGVSTFLNFDANTFYIDGTNNEIGIGTNTPNQKLHVVGTTEIDGRLDLDDGNTSVYIGNLAGVNSTASATGNVFVGKSSGTTNTSGYHNTFLGFESGKFNTTGFRNTAVGYQSGEDITTAQENTLLGFQSGRNVTTGNYNTFFGVASGDQINIGLRNNMIGHETGKQLTDAQDNTFIGYRAGHLLNTGNKNVFIGSLAGATDFGEGPVNDLDNASNSIFIGYNTKSNADNIDNVIVIGHDSWGNGTNTTRIGNISTTKTYLDGELYIDNLNAVAPSTEEVLTLGAPVQKVNVNQIGVPVSTYTASEAGSVSINFASDGRHIAEVDCSGVTSAFTANVIGEGTMTTDFAAIYNVRFHSVGASNITVTLDAGDTWYNEKGDVITTLTLTANEDKIMTFYTKDGINFYTME